MSCFIVGPNERPPAHAQDEDFGEEEEEEDEEKMKGMSEEQKKALATAKQGLFILGEPNLIKKYFQLSINIMKAEGLPKCDSGGSCNGFLSVRAVGIVQITNVVEQN